MLITLFCLCSVVNLFEKLLVCSLERIGFVARQRYFRSIPPKSAAKYGALLLPVSVVFIHKTVWSCGHLDAGLLASTKHFLSNW